MDSTETRNSPFPHSLQQIQTIDFFRDIAIGDSRPKYAHKKDSLKTIICTKCFVTDSSKKKILYRFSHVEMVKLNFDSSDRRNAVQKSCWQLPTWYKKIP